MTNPTLATSVTLQKPALFGTRLKSAREALGMDCKEVAGALRLHEKIIIMIENGEYKTDIPMTFIRGYIRNYSKLMNIPDKELHEVMELMKPKLDVDEEDAMASGQTHLTVSGPATTMPMNLDSLLMKLFTVLLAITLIGLVGVWWHKHHPSSTPSHEVISLPKIDAPVETAKVAAPVVVKKVTVSPPNDPAALNQFIAQLNRPVQFLMTMILFLSILTISMRLYAAPVMAGVRSTRSKRHVKPEFDIDRFLKLNLIPAKFMIATAIIMVSGTGSFLWYHHTNKPVTIASTKPVATQAKQEATIHPETDPMLIMTVETLVPSPTYRSLLLTAYQPYALQTMQIALDQYIADAAAARFILTDRSTPIGQFARKKSRRHRSMNYSNIHSNHENQSEYGSSPPPPYYYQQR